MHNLSNSYSLNKYLCLLDASSQLYDTYVTNLRSSYSPSHTKIWLALTFPRVPTACSCPWPAAAMFSLSGFCSFWQSLACQPAAYSTTDSQMLPRPLYLQLPCDSTWQLQLAGPSCARGGAADMGNSGWFDQGKEDVTHDCIGRAEQPQNTFPSCGIVPCACSRAQKPAHHYSLVSRPGDSGI